MISYRHVPDLMLICQCKNKCTVYVPAPLPVCLPHAMLVLAPLLVCLLLALLFACCLPCVPD